MQSRAQPWSWSTSEPAGTPPKLLTWDASMADGGWTRILSGVRPDSTEEPEWTPSS
jgi:hypothetical protein